MADRCPYSRHRGSGWKHRYPQSLVRTRPSSSLPCTCELAVLTTVRVRRGTVRPTLPELSRGLPVRTQGAYGLREPVRDRQDQDTRGQGEVRGDNERSPGRGK